MSAVECLEHPWMKKEFNTPTISVSGTSPSVPRSCKSTTLPNTPTANWNTLDDWASLSSNYNLNNSNNNLISSNVVIPDNNLTPTIMSPNCITPTLGSSPRDISHFPQQRPYFSYRPSTSAHSSTHSLCKGTSRQNLDRLRSQSKSREVLVERLQLSSQRKTVSRSRERLLDAHYALTKSREQLYNNKSFSHSVEDLQPYDFFNNDNDFNKSMNNVYMLPIYPSVYEDRFTTELHKSLASIEKIDEVLSENHDNHHNVLSLESRQSVNQMTDDEYNTYLARLYPVVRRTDEEPPKQLERTTFQGGRNSQPCERHCPRHNRPYTIENQITKRNKPLNTYNKNENQRKLKENDDVKKEKRRNQEKPKPKPILKNKIEKKPIISLKRDNSLEKPRRGSVSHIEQRIQERHERLQEKNDRQKKVDKVQKQRSNSIRDKPRRHSTESEKSRDADKVKNGKKSTSLTTRRNSFPARKPPNLTKKRNDSQSSSPSTSLESVKESITVKSCPPMTSTATKKNETITISKRRERPNSLQLLPKKSDSIESRMSESSDSRMSESMDSQVSDNRGDIDEAYVSFEETVDDGIFSRSESMDSSTTLSSNSTLHAKDSSADNLDTTFQDLLITETSRNSEGTSPKYESNPIECLGITLINEKSTDPLAVIQEDDSDFKSKTFSRSISTSSDIGSMLSEGSDLSSEEYYRKLSHTKESSPDYCFDPKSRFRSNSIQTQSSFPSMPFKLSRSNSVHLDTPLSGMARPWGEVCQGSVFRALTMFRQQSTESSSSGSSTSSRRRSSNWSTAEGLDQILEKNRSENDINLNEDITVAPLFKISDYAHTSTSEIPEPPPLPNKTSCSKFNNKNAHQINCKNTDSISVIKTIVPSSITKSSSTTSLSTDTLSSNPCPQQPLNYSSCVSKSKLPVRPSNIPIRSRY